MGSEIKHLEVSSLDFFSSISSDLTSSSSLSLPIRKGESNTGLNVCTSPPESLKNHQQLDLTGRKVDRAHLPGHGDRGADCGSAFPRHCEACGHTYWARNSCHERQCPKCWQLWAWEQSGIDAERLWAGMNMKYDDDWQSRIDVRVRLMHTIVTTIDDGECDIEDIRARTRARNYRAHLVGGLDIVHLERQDPVTRKYHLDGTFHSHSISAVVGSIEVNKKGSKCPNDFFKVIPDPVCKCCGHFEAEGAAYCDKCGAKRTYDGIQTIEQLRDLIFYLLTHCCVVDSVHSVTWYGNMSYRSYNTKQLEEYLSTHDLDEVLRNGEPLPRSGTCPRCGNPDTVPCEQYDQAAARYLRVHDLPEDPPPGPFHTRISDDQDRVRVIKPRPTRKHHPSVPVVSE
jgi:hypothetical protein